MKTQASTSIRFPQRSDWFAAAKRLDKNADMPMSEMVRHIRHWKQTGQQSSVEYTQDDRYSC